MRIMWICGGLLPDACSQAGYMDSRINGGFMAASLNAISGLGNNCEFCVLSWDKRTCDIKVDNVRHVSFFGKPVRGVPPSGACQRAMKIIDEFKPDIIQILGTEGVFANLPKWVFENCPVVISLQGIMAACAPKYTGDIAPFEMKCCLWNIGCRLRGISPWDEQKRWIERRANAEADVMSKCKYFIGRTEFDRAWVKYYNSEAIYYTVNETMRPEFYTARSNIPSRVPHSIYCGGAAGYPLKGVHWLMRAVASLRKDFPDIKLRIANASALRRSDVSFFSRIRQGAYTCYLRKLISDLEIEDVICPLPTLSAEEVCDELQKASVFVLPSLCENSPNSLCEAMIMGTPSIATYVGGVTSIIEDGVTGRVVPASDPAAMALAIREAFEHPDIFQSYAEKAKEVAMTRHDPVANARQLKSVYEAVIKQS